MRKNQVFATPLLTPSTKEDAGRHDEPISEAEIVRRGIVPAELWEKIRSAALALFRRGTDMARARGLLLVDTKYEFGVLPGGELILVDEIHTPDSSRYWYAETYEDIFRSGGEQRQLDKEFFRSWLLERGFRGDGEAPEIRIRSAPKFPGATSRPSRR
jgi:phosphoribosylaminoimidazole-succinocarboxamide synthase